MKITRQDREQFIALKTVRLQLTADCVNVIQKLTKYKLSSCNPRHAQ